MTHPWYLSPTSSPYRFSSVPNPNSSQTPSNTTQECWRAKLWQRLTRAGLPNIDFVGSVTSSNDCGIPAADRNHEGHPGALAIEYVDKNWVPGYMSAARPDVVMMHLGTNDVIQRKKTEDVVKAYTKMVEQMRGVNANVHVLVAQLLPIDNDRFPGANDGIIALNRAFAAWAPTVSTRRSPVVLVDQYTGFDVKKDTTDGEHPNDSGNVKISDRFFPAVAQAVRSVGGGVQTVAEEVEADLGVEVEVEARGYGYPPPRVGRE